MLYAQPYLSRVTDPQACSRQTGRHDIRCLPGLGLVTVLHLGYHGSWCLLLLGVLPAADFACEIHHGVEDDALGNIGIKNMRKALVSRIYKP